MALSKACFNVLGQPYAYEAAPDPSAAGVLLPDPGLFLDDRDLGLRALAGLRAELTAAGVPGGQPRRQPGQARAVPPG